MSVRTILAPYRRAVTVRRYPWPLATSARPDDNRRQPRDAEQCGIGSGHVSPGGFDDPFEQAATAAPDPPRPVVIIDDDDDARFFLKRQLGQIGLSSAILSFSDGSDAVAFLDGCLARAEPFPCLMFLDIKMPCMTGFDVLEWMRERQLLGKTSVAMLTSSDDASDVRRAMTLGAHAFLTKPPPKEVLIQLLRSVARLSGRKHFEHPGKKVLVVDDSAFARRTTRRLFELLGYDVVEAVDGPNALGCFADAKPDLVFLDLVMSGGMYGGEVLARLREMSPMTRIVIATADTQTATADQLLDLGAAAIIHKPVTAEKLGAVLQRV